MRRIPPANEEICRRWMTGMAQPPKARQGDQNAEMAHRIFLKLGIPQTSGRANALPLFFCQNY